MNEEQEKAVEALTKSEEYVSKQACEKMVQSIVSDFQWVLNIAMYQAFLKHFDEPELFLKNIREQWLQRAQSVLRKDLKRFQDTIIKASMKDEKKLNDSFESILNNYTLTIESALKQSETVVDGLIETLLKTTKKDTNNDK